MGRSIPDNSDDTIDMRDVQSRIDDLESDLEDLETALQDAKDAYEEAEQKWKEFQEEHDEWCGSPDEEVEAEEARAEIGRKEEELNNWKNGDEGKELETLKELRSECGLEDTLIRDSYFETYARQLAEDIGAIKGDEGWPLNCIDWEQATNELKMDYTTVEFDGETYHYRS